MTGRAQQPAACSGVDLAAYLRRIDYAGPLQASPAVLKALHLAHATHIPFENIDVLRQRPIALGIEALQAKLVAARRGGYCFEHNLLFAAVLRQLGFRVRELAARVRYRTTLVLPRTHMLLRVAFADGEAWLADVGFGAEGLLLPVPFGQQEVRHYAWTYRIAEQSDAEHLYILQSQRAGAWMDLYAFTLASQQAADFEMANFYVSHHPESRFVRTLTVQLPTPEARYILRDRELCIDRGAEISSRVIADAELAALLADTFGLLGWDGPNAGEQLLGPEQAGDALAIADLPVAHGQQRVG